MTLAERARRPLQDDRAARKTATPLTRCPARVQCDATESDDRQIRVDNREVNFRFEHVIDKVGQHKLRAQRNDFNNLCIGIAVFSHCLEVFRRYFPSGLRDFSGKVGRSMFLRIISPPSTCKMYLVGRHLRHAAGVPSPRSARSFAPCMSKVALFCPIRGTSVAAAFCKAWGSRRWRQQAPGFHGPRANPAASFRWSQSCLT